MLSDREKTQYDPDDDDSTVQAGKLFKIECQESRPFMKPVL